MARRRGDALGGSLGKRPAADRFDVGLPFDGSVYPRKGKGHGVQGEAQYLDLLAKWDKDASWLAWRKGLSLAHTQLVGAAERFTAIEVTYRDPLAPVPLWQTGRALLAGFTSRESPDGRWTVCIRPRGTVITRRPVGAMQWREVWLNLTDDPEAPPQRLLELDYSTVSAKATGVVPLDFNSSLVGEVIEDSAISATALDPDSTVGIGLQCVAVYQDEFKVYFDASRYWQRERTSDGRLVLKEHGVGLQDPAPSFAPQRHLTMATIVSCNCPAHLGVVFARQLSGGRLGSQDLFPQRSPSGLDGVSRSSSANPEGVRRRFALLSWARTPGQECKHCHACRFALGAPLAEPTDMLSLASDYWLDIKRMRQIEDMDAPLCDPRFLDDLRQSLLSEQAFSGLDITMLAASVGDAFGVIPQRVELAAAQLAAPGTRVALKALGEAELRANEQRYVVNPRDDDSAKFGDWWVGRGTANVALAYEGPGQTLGTPAITPLPPGTVDLPTAIP
jgi:hypothetical protein